MISLSIKEAAHIIKGEMIAVDEAQFVTSVSLDSRKIDNGGLFIALVGHYFDGHDFANMAVEQGAVAVIVNRRIDALLPQIVVHDTHKALGELALWMREQSTAKFVALTGSSGKTSVKEMTAAILKQCGQTLYTQGNFNNDIGVPLTLLRLTKQDKFAVIELGANHIGEIAYTTRLVKPQSALVNNIASAHLEGFGSLDGVAKAKGEIFESLPEGGTAVINLDSHSDKWFEKLSSQNVKTFSLNPLSKADFYASNIVEQQQGMEFVLHTPIGNQKVYLPLIGQHNIANVLAASALAISVGARLEDLEQGLLTIQPVKGRLYPILLNCEQVIFDDTYNANVGSMEAAIDVLANQKGYRVLVVGDMAELGKDSSYYHQQIGEAAKNANIDCVVSVGIESELISQYSQCGHHFKNKSKAAEFLANLLAKQKKVAMLFKGSRSAKMEEIIDILRNEQG